MTYLAILSANTDLYRTEARALIDGYNNYHREDLKVFEYIGDDDHTHMDDDVLFMACSDKDTIEKQDILYRWFLDQSDAEWLIKTNTCTVVNLPKLLPELERMDGTKVYCAFPLCIELDGILYEYPMGNFNVLHRDTVQKIVDTVDNIRRDTPDVKFPWVISDDVHLGALMKLASINMNMLWSYSIQKRLRNMFLESFDYQATSLQVTPDVYSAYLKIQPDTEGPNGEWGMCNDPDAIQDIRVWYEPEIIRMVFNEFYRS